MRVEPLDDLEMTITTCDQHWSCSVVVWSRDVHGSTVRVEPSDGLEITFVASVRHWSGSTVVWSRDEPLEDQLVVIDESRDGHDRRRDLNFIWNIGWERLRADFTF